MNKTGIVLLLLLPFFIACQGLVEQMAFFPDTTDLIAPGDLPENVRELFIFPEEGIRLQSYFLADSASDKILIYFHGNAGNIGHRLAALQHIREMGVNVLGLSYRGYGASSGRPGEEGLYRDGQAAFGFARDSLGFSESNIFLMGRSLGSTVAMHTARNKNLAGVILVSPLSSARDQAGVMGMGLIAPLAGNAFNNLEKAVHLRCPLLIIHGTADTVIPIGLGRKLYNAITAPKRFITIKGAGHNNLSSPQYADTYWRAIGDFIAPDVKDAR